MNICFFACFPMIPYEGGVQRVTTILSRELSKRGYGIVYLFYSEERKHKLNNPAIEFPQYYLDVTSNDDNTVKESIERFIRKHQIDIIINQTPEEQGCWILKMISDAVPVVSVCHVVPFLEHRCTRSTILREFPYDSLKLVCYKVIALLSPWFYRKYAIKKSRQLYYRVLQCSEAFVFISERYFPRIMHYMPDFPKEKLKAINNPTSFDNSPCNYSDKKNIILWVGRVDTNKNCIDFLKAWRSFSQNNPDWKAVVAGDGQELNKCKKYVEKHKLVNISILGYCKDVTKLYMEAKLFVSTSFGESWGMSLTEAMSMGCVPCVYNTYETLADIVDDDIDGLLCDPMPDSLAEKLGVLAADENKMHKMMVNVQHKVKRYEVTRICVQWEDLLNNIVSNREYRKQ